MLTARQMMVRRSGIGGSDAPPICGVDPYNSLMNIFLSKIHPNHNIDLSGNEAVEHGNAFEPSIADLFMQRLKVKVKKPNGILRHPDHTWMLANPDRLIVGEDRGIEIKNRGYHMRSKYGQAGSDEVLEADRIQCQHYMAVTGFSEWDVWVCFGGQKSVSFHLKRDDDHIKKIIKMESEFWHDHVLKRIAPPCKTSKDVELLFDADETAFIIADEHILREISKMREIKENEKLFNFWFEELREGLCFKMGAATSIVDERGEPLLTWKESKARDSFDLTRFKCENPQLYAAYTVSKKCNRRFTLKGEIG